MRLRTKGPPPVLGEIRKRFGDRVAGVVAACSDTDQAEKPAWKPRKDDYVAELRTAPPEVLLVSLADKVHNARSILADYRRIGEELWPRFTGTRDQQLWYYGELSEIFTHRCPGPLADQLAQTVEALAAEIAGRHGRS